MLTDELRTALRNDFDKELVALINKWSDNLDVLNATEHSVDVLGGPLAARLAHIAVFTDIAVNKRTGDMTARRVSNAYADLFRTIVEHYYAKYSTMTPAELLAALREKRI